MFKTEIKYGIITGLFICGWQLIEYSLGFHTDKMHIGEYTTYFVIIIPFITLYMGIKEKRDRINGGHISIGHGIRTGLMISLIATIIMAVFLIVYYNLINPDFFEIGIAYQKEKLMVRGRTSEEIALEMGNLKSMFSFVNRFLFGTLGIVTSGFIISIAVSMFLKKDSNRTLSI